MVYTTGMRAFLASSLLLASVATAHADPGRVLWMDNPDFAQAPPPKASVSNIIYINRCVGNCRITASDHNDSTHDLEWFSTANGEAPGTQYTLSEFALGDTTFNAMVDCVKKVYEPYNVSIVTDDPGDTPHTEVYAAGVDTEIGLSGAGGVGGTLGGCQPLENNVAFAFVNEYPATAVNYLCGVIAQETGHSFGMPSHVWNCTDAMSYSYDGPCEGGVGAAPIGYFRNLNMPCGDFAEGQPACSCGTSVNDHQHLIDIFGATGTAPEAPTLTILQPQDGANIAGNQIFAASASSPRGVFRVEVYLNGWLWGVDQLPAKMEPGDFPPPNYIVEVPDNFPDGLYDVEFRAYDDIGTMTSVTESVVKGSACTGSGQGSCLTGQTCSGGKCAWPAPTGEIGDACTYDQECIGPNIYDGKCAALSDGTQICTTACFGPPNDACPDMFECQVTDVQANTGLCVAATPDKPGCCSTTSDAPPVMPIALGTLVGALVMRRRRRRC